MLCIAIFYGGHSWIQEPDFTLLRGVLATSSKSKAFKRSSSPSDIEKALNKNSQLAGNKLTRLESASQLASQLPATHRSIHPREDRVTCNGNNQARNKSVVVVGDRTSGQADRRETGDTLKAIEMIR